MKTFEFHPHTAQAVRVSAKDLAAAQQLAGVPVGTPWRVVPTARQVAKTKNLMRGL